MKLLKTIAQVIFFIVFAQLCRLLSDHFNLPIPGAIIGIVIMFMLLKLNIIKLEWVELGAKVLIAEMMLFFVPSVVGVMQYKELIVTQGIHILLTIIISTIFVMLSSGYVSEWLSKRKEEKA